MDEARLRQQVCQAAYQLWARGLITGDSGLVSVELHRRRFLVTPTHARRPNLHPEDILTVDMGGLSIQSGASGSGGGGDAVAPTLWKPHRAAYKVNLAVEGVPTSVGTPAPAPASGKAAGNARPRFVTAVVLADPPMLLALMRLLPHDDRVDLPGLGISGASAGGGTSGGGGGGVPIVEGRDDHQITDALLHSPGVLVRGLGAVVAADHLTNALNWLERLDAAARAEFAVGGPLSRAAHRPIRTLDTDPADPADLEAAPEPAELPVDEEEAHPTQAHP